MEEVLLTGAAGFIGSHLAESLVKRGYRVTGIDSFTRNYPRPYKKANLKSLLREERFKLYELDLARYEIPKEALSASYVLHLAAKPGVRGSWGNAFGEYVESNLLATQRLLESFRDREIERFIFASSSSVYGDCGAQASSEYDNLRPLSPYGVTKLAGEHACRAYCESHGVPVVLLRYFTVYGERQRPDMAFHIFLKSLHMKEELTVYGDGDQQREFTYVGDAVSASIAAMQKAEKGAVFNIGGGTSATINEIIEMMQCVTGRKAKVRFVEGQKGEVRATRANIERARSLLGYEPACTLPEGIERQYRWQRGIYEAH